MEPRYLSTDEVDTSTKDGNPPGPTKMELYLAEVAEIDRLDRKEAERRRAKRKRAKKARRLNRRK